MSDNPDAVPGKILVGASGEGKGRAYHYLSLPLGNRHGLISGATGGGKTVSLQRLAEGFSKAGTAVFLADVERMALGDVAAALGIAAPAARARVSRARKRLRRALTEGGGR